MSVSMQPSQYQPPDIKDVLLTFPTKHVMLVTLNRPSRLNAIPSWLHDQLHKLFKWFDSEPSLRCAVLTGAGKTFCAGADLKEWKKRSDTPESSTPERWNTSGFGGLSNRLGKKPIIAAVNGPCIGGGMEMLINCDLVVAGRHRPRFGLPEVRRGVVASAGALPRLIRTVGKQRAGELALLGRMYNSEQMKDWGLVNFVIDDEKSSEGVVAEAVRLAAEIADNSPDSVITSREGLRLGWEAIGPVFATEILGKGLFGRMDGGENMKEGLRSFGERRKAVWTDSKL